MIRRIYDQWWITALVWVAFFESLLPVGWDYLIVSVVTVFVERHEIFGLIEAIILKPRLIRRLLSLVAGREILWPYHADDWPVFGWLCRILAFILTISLFGGFAFVLAMAAGIVQPVTGMLWPSAPDWVPAGVVLLLLLSVIVISLLIYAHVIGFIWYFGGLHTQTSGEYRLRVDGRSPILYLRSFEQDVSWKWYGQVYQELEWFTIFQPIGPFIAIAQPNAKYPAVGASRFQAADDEWQEVVIRLIKKSSLILIRCGATPGLGWEFRESFLNSPSERIVLLVPADPVIYERARILFFDQTEIAIPDWPSAPGCSGADRYWFADNMLFGVITFCSTQQPRFYLLFRRGIRVLGRTFLWRYPLPLEAYVLGAIAHSLKDDELDDDSYGDGLRVRQISEPQYEKMLFVNQLMQGVRARYGAVPSKTNVWRPLPGRIKTLPAREIRIRR